MRYFNDDGVEVFSMGGPGEVFVTAEEYENAVRNGDTGEVTKPEDWGREALAVLEKGLFGDLLND